MKRKKIIISVIIALVLIAVVSFLAVFIKANKEFTVSLYFKNAASNTLDTEARIIEHSKGAADKEIFYSVLTELQEGPKANSGLVNPFGDVKITDCRLDEDEKTAYIDLSANFSEKEPAEQLFIKSSLVYTLTALGFIDSVYIAESGVSDDTAVPLNRKNLLLNPDIASEKINYQTMTLYFTNNEGKSLFSEQRLIEVKQSQDLEYQLVEQLLAGPDGAGLASPIPTGTKLINTTTENGICYVNLSQAFLNKNSQTGLSAVSVYSIVNSLTALDTVNAVQFYIEGQKVSDAAGEVDISKELERNESIIAKGISN